MRKPVSLSILLSALLLLGGSITLVAGPFALSAVADDHQSTEPDRGDDDDDRPERGTLSVPTDFPTIASAIGAAPDGSKIRIAPGVYAETLRIEGKRLTLQGSGGGRTVLVAPSRETGILTYAAGGGGRLKHLSFAGGAYAIGTDRNGGLPSTLDVKDVSVTGGFRGIYGSFSGLSLTNVSVTRTEWTGISITHVESFIDLLEVDVQGAGSVGLYIDNSAGGKVNISGRYHHNAYGGVQLVGGEASFFVTIADHNGLFGVMLKDVQAGMFLSFLEDQIDAPPEYGSGSGCEGVGLLAVGASKVFVGVTWFEDNCMGISAGPDTSITITENVFSSTTGELEGIFFGGDLIEDGDNVCGFDMGTADEMQVSCSEFNLSPVEPPEALGPDALE